AGIPRSPKENHHRLPSGAEAWLLDPTHMGVAPCKLPWALASFPTLISFSEKQAEFPSRIQLLKALPEGWRVGSELKSSGGDWERSKAKLLDI
ncbi:hypothetical protein ACQP3J_28280, partial [Escherichia coli]